MNEFWFEENYDFQCERLRFDFEVSFGNAAFSVEK